ncbi:hypothetical protein AAHH78_33795, partial [Burkholderia pseudomallei]
MTAALGMNDEGEAGGEAEAGEVGEVGEMAGRRGEENASDGCRDTAWRRRGGSNWGARTSVRINTRTGARRASIRA